MNQIDVDQFINNVPYTKIRKTLYMLTTKSGVQKYYLSSGEPFEEEVVQRGKSYFVVEDGEEVKVRLEKIDRAELHDLRNRLR